MLSAVMLTSCKDQTVSFAEQTSAGGLIPEQFIPADIGMFLSYSLLNDEQFEATQKILEKIGDPDKASETIADNFENQFGDLGIDYKTDLEPAFGDQYRVIFAAKSGPETASGSTTEAFSVVTLEDPAMMKSTLDRLVTEEKMALENVSGEDAYRSADGKLFTSVHEDLFFVSDSAENLLGMINMDEEESLWASDEYQDDIERVGGDHVFYVLIYPQAFGNLQSELASTGLGLQGMAAILSNEGLVVRAEEDGFRFDGFAIGDKAKAKEIGSDVSFDRIPKNKAYLFKEIPSSGLMAYIENSSLKQTLELAQELNSEDYGLSSFETTVRNYFGMDLQDDILSFMDKGYAIALHQNGEGIVPGITIYFDVSSDAANAKTFMDKIDAQLSSLIMVFEQALPGAISKSTTEIEGVELNTLELDLSKLPNTSASPLPAVVTGSSVKLSYGIIDDRLLITTATAWEEEDFVAISKSGLYDQLSSKLEDVDQGLILVDAEGIASFSMALKALREQLGLDVGEFDFEELLDGFVGGIAASKAEAYEAKLGGFLKIKD